MDALIVVDMQVGLLNGEPKHDLRGVIERINRLAAKIRERSGVVEQMPTSRHNAASVGTGAA